MVATRKKTLTGLPVGTRWRTTDGHTYEISGFYTRGGKNGYHVKRDGVHIKDGVGGIRYIDEDEVKDLRSNKI